jgi:hypothetical protein
VFCNPYLANIFFEKIRNSNLSKINLVTAQSDLSISRKVYNSKPNFVMNWYTTNLRLDKKNLIAIPLGLSDPSGKNLSFKDFIELSDRSINKTKKIYMNYEVNTNFFNRVNLTRKYKDNESFVYQESKLELIDYLTELSTYKYTLSPWGNGYDTHRFWESIYAGSIPITKEHLTYSSSKDLPAVLLKNYKNINIDILETKDFKMEKFNFDKLTVDFWSDYFHSGLKLKNKNFQEFEFTKSEINEILSYYKTIQTRAKLIKNSKTFLRRAFKKILTNG